jgi:hypothetical protein
MNAHRDSPQEEELTPFECAHLLRTVDEKLIDLLKSLAPSEWELQTVAPLWKVRDVAAHLLDTALRKLSMVRDFCYVEDAMYGDHISSAHTCSLSISIPYKLFRAPALPW